MVYGPDQETFFPGQVEQRSGEVPIVAKRVDDQDDPFRIHRPKVATAVKDLGGRGELAQRDIQRWSDDNDPGPSLQQAMDLVLRFLIPAQDKAGPALYVQRDLQSRIRRHNSSAGMLYHNNRKHSA